MKRIDFSKLRKGDILLTTSNKPRSKVIRTATRSDISHAMLHVANGSVMDSTGDGCTLATSKGRFTTTVVPFMPTAQSTRSIR